MNAEPALNERAKLLTPTFGAYIGFALRGHLANLAGDGRGRIIKTVSALQSLGSSVYAITCRDFNGQEYKITVELAQPRTGEGETG